MTKNKILEAMRQKLHCLQENLNSNNSELLIGNHRGHKNVTQYFSSTKRTVICESNMCRNYYSGIKGK